MKKYFIFITIILFMSACGNQSNKEKSDEMTPEQEIVFVQEESIVIDSSIKATEAQVENSEEQVEELLKGI